MAIYLKCPECNSEHVSHFEYDFGVDQETGYRDSGERAKCLDCRFEAESDEFKTEEEDESSGWDESDEGDRQFDMQMEDGV